MAYTINKTSGAVLATVSDGTIDTTTNLTLVGKNYAGYGEFLNENFVKVLENFANTSAPSSPLLGQLWWDSTNAVLKVYNTTGWKPIVSTVVSSSTPTNVITGDMWWDTVNAQLKVYNGAGFTLIGPAYSAGSGVSGAVVDTVTDTLAASHVIIRFFCADVTVAIISKDATFTPSPAITGFTTVVPGMNLAGTGTVSGIQMTGLSSNANTLDTIDSTSFLRSDQNDTTTGTLGVLNDTGLNIGVDSDLSLFISGSDATIRNQTSNGDINLRVNIGGVATTALTLDGATGIFVPGADNVYDLGTTSLRFKTIYGVSTSALYADLAERFAADADYPAGTVMSMGGAAEVTSCATDASEDVFGVVSTNAAYLMNDGAGENATHPAIALAGRVPVRVIGLISKGDRLVSAGNGVARAGKKTELTAFNVIGRALQDKITEGEGVIEAVVQLNR
tara:strand:- start:8893 stop:10236 length:1344 start_codon:yes stop_codon:yes gene_type:complete